MAQKVKDKRAIGILETFDIYEKRARNISDKHPELQPQIDGYCAAILDCKNEVISVFGEEIGYED